MYLMLLTVQADRPDRQHTGCKLAVQSTGSHQAVLGVHEHVNSYCNNQLQTG